MTKFKPNQSIKNILKQYGNVAYVYSDGIVILEYKKIKVNGLEFKKEFIHIFPIKQTIYFSRGMYASDKENKMIGRFCFHNATLLIDGIDYIEVWLKNSTEGIKEKGLSLQTFIIYTLSGMQITSHNIPSVIGGDISLTNEDPLSINNWKTSYSDCIVMHETPDKA